MRRPFAMTRRALRMPKGSGFVPTMVDGCALWLPPGRVTTVDAAVTDGSDLTTGSWHLSDASATDPFTITDFADLIPQIHYAYNTAANVRVGYPATWTMTIPVGGSQFQGIYPNAGTATSNIFLDTVNGTILAQGADILSSSYIGGVLKFATVVKVSGRIFLYTMSAGNLAGLTYQGDASNHLTAKLTDVSIVQQQSAQWSDISGQNNHAVQAVAANRPAYLYDARGRPYLYNPAVASCVIKAAIAGFVKPCTVFVTGFWNSTTGTLFDGYNSNTLRLLRNVTNEVDMYSGTLVAGTPAQAVTDRHTYATVWNGAATQLWQDKVLVATSGNPGDTAPGGLSLLNVAGSGAAPDGGVYSAVVYNRVLNAQEIGRVSDYLQATT